MKGRGDPRNRRHVTQGEIDFRASMLMHAALRSVDIPAQFDPAKLDIHPEVRQLLWLEAAEIECRKARAYPEEFNRILFSQIQKGN